MKKGICQLISILCVMSLLFTGVAFADNGQGAAGEQDPVDTVSEGIYVDAGDVNEDPVDEMPLETDEPLSDLENSNPAKDIAPDQVGLDGTSEPLDGSLDDAGELAAEVDRELDGVAPAVKLHPMVMELKDTKAWDSAHLLSVSRKLNMLTRNHLRYIKTHPRAERAIVLLTDETVRLAHSYVKNDRIKVRVYRNAAQTYAMLGCYKRAAGVIELALRLAPDRKASYADLAKLYRKLGAPGLKVFVRGQRPDFGNVPPVVLDGRTMVPIRAISETMGAIVKFKSNKVFINNGNINVNLQINNKSAVVNGKNVNLDAPVKVVNGRTIVPLRFVSENLGAQVDYDSANGMVTVE